MIFVSYSWVDSTFAQDIAVLLNDLGYQVWIDYEYLDLSKPLKPQITEGILSSENFIFTDSPSARASNWVQFELSLVNASQKIIQIVCSPSQNSVRNFRKIAEYGLLSALMFQTTSWKKASDSSKISHLTSLAPDRAGARAIGGPTRIDVEFLAKVIPTHPRGG